MIWAGRHQIFINIWQSYRKLLKFSASPLILAVLALAPIAVADSDPEICPRPRFGSAIPYPADLRSNGGKIDLNLSFRTFTDRYGLIRYCYLYETKTSSPTLRLNPGDELILNLKNDLPAQEAPAGAEIHRHGTGDCSSGLMSGSSTNLHFHGLGVPPVCHQDEVIHTLLQPGDPAFAYRIRIPRDQPPGLYWYHPHPHGFSERQVVGGASGALIVEGIEKMKPQVAGLPERVLVLRDQMIPGRRFGDDDASDGPAKDISLNYVAILSPIFRPAVLPVKPAQVEFWRVLNASADTYFDLQVRFGPTIQDVHIPQTLELIAMDGVPTGSAPNAAQRQNILLSPGARAEFVVRTPPVGTYAQLVTRAYDTGPDGERDPYRAIANISAAVDAPPTPSSIPAVTSKPQPVSYELQSIAPAGRRKLFLSEARVDPKDPTSKLVYFITVDGAIPKVFDMHQAKPDVTVLGGTVEDWTIENRAREAHAFHIHQIHFQVLERDGRDALEPMLRDTIDLPFWDGQEPYPSVKLRMDFRAPEIVGTFLFHCHLLEHEDGGMMGSILVLPVENR